MEPFFDAPAGLYFGGARIAAHWTDDRHVVLVNTFLPLEDADGDELARRKAKPAVVEVDVATHAVTRITDLETPGLGQKAASGDLGDSQLIGRDLVLVSRPDRLKTVSRVFRRNIDGWAETRDADIDALLGAKSDLVLSIAQDLNTPAEIAAKRLSSGRSRIVTDLNPQIRGIELGKAQIVEWTTPDGRVRKGGLVLPPGIAPGMRVPLVIQTHGFPETTFLLDGPGNSPSGFAARELAAVGIAVLQTPDTSEQGARRELDSQMEIYRGAIDRLDQMGVVDRSKIGMHGWSRTGLFVQHAITFSDLGIAAASVSDPSNISVLYHALSFGAGYPGMQEQERLIGAPLWGEGVKLWAERDPILHLDRVKAPLRMEMYGRTTMGWWDVYALLRRHNRPAEYLYYPDGLHVLTKPKERLTSQQGNVNWYRFWLKGEEDSDPAKAAQYARWRKLRDEAAEVP
jgi:dipeptidyl aminopeptidase/acylaminoacyl peptidase